MALEIRHLRYFVAAVEEGSLIAAADRLHVAQPALSRRVRDLERDLGCALLERGRHGVTPTAAGSMFYNRAVRMLDELEVAVEEMRRLGETADQPLRFGIVNTSRKYSFIHERAAAFQQGNPAFPIHFMADFSHRMGQMLAEGRLDLALVYGSGPPPAGILRRPILQEHMILAVHPSHPLAVQRPAALSELNAVPLTWLRLRGNDDSQALLRQRLQSHGVEPVIGRTARSYEEMIDLTLASGGAMIVIASTISLVRRGAMVFRPLPELDIRNRLCLDWTAAFAQTPGGRIVHALEEAIADHQRKLRMGEVEDAALFGHAIVELP